MSGEGRKRTCLSGSWMGGSAPVSDAHDIPATEQTRKGRLRPKHRTQPSQLHTRVHMPAEAYGALPGGRRLRHGSDVCGKVGRNAVQCSELQAHLEAIDGRQTQVAFDSPRKSSGRRT
jgi:hypothetical protein